VDASIRAIRRTTNPGTLSAHANAAGEPRSNSGNDDAPYIWAPPFQEPLQLWERDVTLTAGAELLEPIDMDDFRVVSTLFRYVPATDTSQLCIIPMVGGNIDDDLITQLGIESPMFPLGFVRGVVTVVGGPASGEPYTQDFAARTTLPTLLQTTVVTANTPIVLTLDFEACGYKRFSLALYEIGVGEMSPTFGTISISFARHT
jgi:hypothetical protein